MIVFVGTNVRAQVSCSTPGSSQVELVDQEGTILATYAFLNDPDDLPAQFCLGQDLVLIGAGRLVYTASKTAIKSLELPTPFYTFLPTADVVVVVHETGAWAIGPAFDDGVRWRREFPDIVTRYRIVDSRVEIELDDSSSVSIDLASGSSVQ